MLSFATEEGLVRGADDPELERDRWDRGALVELSEGLSAEKAIELGLADGRSDSLEDTSRRMGLGGLPPPVSDRGLVRWVERLGRSQGLMILLLIVGFIALSSEANAPGMGVPGFISLVCFGLYFWMRYLAGTAEWLELVLFILGIICIAIEVLVVPGFGVFGVGGILMTLLALVLMSQTFVVPKNMYQLGVLTRGLWVAIGGLFGLFGGFLVMRWLFPHVPLFNALVMETPDSSAVDQAERLANFNHLQGKVGKTTTPLRPSGKARFGDEIIQVVSEGSMVDSGAEIRVIDVFGDPRCCRTRRVACDAAVLRLRVTRSVCDPVGGRVHDTDRGVARCRRSHCGFGCDRHRFHTFDDRWGNRPADYFDHHAHYFGHVDPRLA